MIDKDINVKKIDLSGVSFPTNDASTCALIYTAVRNTYGFPLYLTNFKINDEKRDSVLVNPIILENQTIINLNDCHLIVTPIEIFVGKGVYGASLESIVDKDGNPRFVEGSVSNVDLLPEGVTLDYGKWSLSGTHLIIVACVRIAAGYTLNNIETLTFKLPPYIIDKITALTDSNLVSKQTYAIIGAKTWSGVVGDTIGYWFKQPTSISLNQEAVTTTFENDRIIRYNLDLLIDAD